jgi:hypothetical protein
VATQLDGVVNARPSPAGAVKVGTPGSGVVIVRTRVDLPGFKTQGGLPPATPQPPRPRRA